MDKRYLLKLSGGARAMGSVGLMTTLMLAASARDALAAGESGSGAAWTVDRPGGPVNTEYHEAFSSMTPDGLTLFISSNRPGGHGNDPADIFWAAASYDIYVTHRPSLDAPWGPVVTLGDEINTTGSEHSPMLSPDGHYLYFVSDRTDLENFGGGDLFVSYREDVNDDQGWETPVNLGDSVNSPFVESCPFYEVTEDGAAHLYFVQSGEGGPETLDFKVSVLDRGTGAFSHPRTVDISTPIGDGHLDSAHGYIWAFDYPGGRGGSDIWRSAPDPAQDDPARKWRQPVNLSPPVNSEFNDIMPSATADGSRLMFQSDRPGGSGGFDIYEARK